MSFDASHGSFHYNSFFRFTFTKPKLNEYCILRQKIENSKDIDDSEQVYYYLIKTLVLRHINFEVSITIHENILLCHKNTYKIKILMKHFER